MEVKNIEDLNLPTVSISAGETLLEEGTTSTTIYILQTGKVSISASNEFLCDCDIKGTVFGESSVLLNRDTSAKVEVTEDATFLKIDDAANYLKKQPELIFSIAQILAGRLIHMNEVFVDIKHNSDQPLSAKLKSKLYKWMIVTNKFFDRDVLEPFTAVDANKDN